MKERKQTMKPTTKTAFETEYRIVTPDGENVLDDTGWPRTFKHKRTAQSWIKMMKARGDKTNYSIIAETFEVIYCKPE